MKKLYFLSSCSTCKRILDSWAPLPEELELRDLKQQPLAAAELDELRRRAGSFEALFSRRARLFRARGLHECELGEEDYRRLLLEAYTFLKRPVLVLDDEIFVGSSKKVVVAAREALARMRAGK